MLTQYPTSIYRHVFVGRESELLQLEAAFGAAREGHGGLALLVGEPGIGKTALCDQIASRVSRCGGRALVGHCYEEGVLRLPYLPFVEVLRDLVWDLPDDELWSSAANDAAELARIVPEIQEKLDLVARGPGDPADDRWRLYRATVDFLCRASIDQPLLVVLEDLHWADEATLSLLQHLARHLSGTRLLIVGTYRDVDLDPLHSLSGTLAELRRIGGYLRVPLRGLSRPEIRCMMEGLEGQGVEDHVVDVVLRQTEGNPLFVQEVVRDLAEQGFGVNPVGLLGSHDGQHGWPELPVPEALREVVGKRLARLSPTCSQMVSIAAVIGRELRLGTLRWVAGFDEETLFAALDEAVRAGILEEHARPGEIRLRFTHAFFRQFLYDGLLAARRARLHPQVARALETEYGTQQEQHAAELWEHFSRSTDRDELAIALSYGRLAAERACAVYAYADSARLLEQVLRLHEQVDPQDRRTRFELLLSLAEALGSAGEPQRAADEIAEEAFQLAVELEDDELASEACRVGFVSLMRHGGMQARAGAAGQRWADRADRHAASASPARVYAELFRGGVIRRERPSRGRDWPHFQQALHDARTIGDPELLYECAGHVLRGIRLGQWDDALHLAEEVVSLPRKGIRRWTASAALSACAEIFLSWGDRPRAEALWREVAELSERTHDLTMLGMGIHDIKSATLDGQLEAALEAAARLQANADQAGVSPRGRQFAVGHSLRAYLYLGRAEETLEDQRLMVEALGRPRLGIALAGAGHVAEAREILDYYVHVWSSKPPDWSIATEPVQHVLELGVILEHRAAVELALPILAPLAHLINARGFLLTCIPRLLGAGAALLGDEQRASAYYAQALAVCQRVRFRPEIALVRLQQAELLLEDALTPTLSQREREQAQAEARAYLDFAIEEFQAMGMQPALERALALRAGCPREETAPPQSAHPARLSAREVEVLRLVARGRSNREIAELLTISINTVARHMTNIFCKTATANRAEAASFATRQGLV